MEHDDLIVDTYSRKEAVEDGLQVDVSKLAKEAGITYPVFLTATAYDKYVTVPEGLTDQDETGRLWDILDVLKFVIEKSEKGSVRLPFLLYVRNDELRAEIANLIAVCGPLDFDDPQPAITVMLPDED